MQKFPIPFIATIFVCTNQRPEGHPKPCCADAGGVELRDELKAMVAERGLKGQVRVCKSGCLDACQRGPAGMSFPDGEYLLGITKDDLERILDEAVADR